MSYQKKIEDAANIFTEKQSVYLGFKAGADFVLENPPPKFMKLYHAIRNFIVGEPKDGELGYACTYCDMGGAGYSSKGDGHHDDIRDVCPVVLAKNALEEFQKEVKNESSKTE